MIETRQQVLERILEQKKPTCPHCGYDMPQSSRLWTSAMTLINKFKKVGKR